MKMPIFPRLIGGRFHGDPVPPDMLGDWTAIPYMLGDGRSFEHEHYRLQTFKVVDRVFSVFVTEGTTDQDVMDAVLEAAGLGDARCVTSRVVMMMAEPPS